MIKKDKNYLWIVVILMVSIPEILFNTTISSIVNYIGKDFLTINSLFFDSRFFINNSTIFLTSLFIELCGLIGLLILSIKSKKIKLLSIPIILWILWLSFVFFLGYTASSIRFW